MTSANDTAAREQFARERRDADRRYNDALTALDRTVTAALGLPAPGREDVARVATALIVFLQQITAFVDTKDREIGAMAEARTSRVEGAIDHIQELRTQVGALQRATQSLIRTQHAAPSAQHPAPAQPSTPSGHSTYVAFEDQFRGAPDAVAARLSAYVPFFAGAELVVDLGCGRGEFLDALRSAGIAARGVDANAEMAAVARERGLDAVEGDAIAFLESFPDESLGGVIATQVIEHLEPAYLLRLVDTAARKMRRGAPIVLETINVACWLAFFSSYLRDFTHVRPVRPDTLQFLLRAGGFERVEIRYSAPVPEPMKMKTIELPPAVASSDDPLAAAIAAVAHTVSVNAVILNSLMFTSLDYAATGFKS